ncbi:MAG: ABC transporter permease [Rhizobiales bacterium]|nr:ABC transporter permease [Hyphomicrobiales bacterium]NRB13854.1 ABC transporter permease [Hyphomicrobiales bacterium]
MKSDLYSIIVENNRINIALFGRWTLAHIGAIERQLFKDYKLALGRKPYKLNVIISGRGIDIVDTSAVLMIKKMQIFATDMDVELADMPDEFNSLSLKLADFDITQKHPKQSKIRGPLDMLEAFGKACLRSYRAFAETPQLLGLFLMAILHTLRKPFEFRFTSMVYHIQYMTIPAIAIVFAVSFMVGAVLTEQVAWRLSIFGAEEYVVGFIGMVTTRETSILLTGMLIAGRSSSSITAEIGSMRMNEEIDAMKVIGLDVMRFLVMPRVMAMLIAFPILTVIGIFAGYAGSAFLLYVRYDIGLSVFIDGIYDGVTIYDIGTALVKTPFMAVMLVLVACNEGMKVQSNAASLGYHTTVSVVKGLFLVIIIDAIIAIYFTQVNLLGS